MIEGLAIERVLAPNPGPYTGPGTNTWVIGDAATAVVLDPGPVIPAHSDAIWKVVNERTVTAVVVTHTHIDHAPLANPLATDAVAPAMGFASSEEFDPDIRLVDGSTVGVGDHTLTVVHTPGHSDDHLCFRLGSVLFTGDHIMGGSSVMVEDMGPYLESLQRIHHTGLTRLYPGHGSEMDEPDRVISWYLAHRMDRERQIVDAMIAGCSTVGDIVEHVYADVDTQLHPLAARSVVAHLRKLSTDGRARSHGENWDSRVELVASYGGD